MKHTYKLKESSSEWLRDEAYTISLCTHVVYKLFPRLRRGGVRLTVSSEPFYRSTPCEVLLGAWVRLTAMDNDWHPLTLSTATTLGRDFGLDVSYGAPFNSTPPIIVGTVHIRFTNAPRTTSHEVTNLPS